MPAHSSTNSGKKTPVEIRRAGASAYRNTNKLQVLLEQWTACQGAWTQSQFYIKMKSKSKHRTFGCRKWLTQAELLGKYGDAAVVNAIIEAKMADPDVMASHVRSHPDMHGQISDDSWLTQVGRVAFRHASFVGPSLNILLLPTFCF